MTSCSSLPVRIIAPDEAIPPLPYDGEPPIWWVVDEAIEEAQKEEAARFWHGIETGIMLGAMLWIVGLVIWLAW